MGEAMTNSTPKNPDHDLFCDLIEFADRIEKARSKAGFPKSLRMSSGGGLHQQVPWLVRQL